MNERKLRFIVDESVDFPVVLHLRNKGYDVTSVVEDCPSLEDNKILKIALEDERILITNDKDFGYLIFKLKIKSKGIILLRLGDQSSKAKIKALDTLIKNYSEKVHGNFIVASEYKVRIKKISYI